MRVDDRITGIALWALAFFVIIMAWHIPAVPGTRFGPDLFPTLIGIGFMVTGTVIFVKGWRSSGTGLFVDVSDWYGHSKGLVATAWTVGGIVVAIAFFDDIGFPLLAFGYAFSMMVMMGARVLPALVITLTTVATAFFVFANLMYVPLPVGPLTFLR